MWLKVRVGEPLLLGDVRADTQFLATRTYLPGRVLRGAWVEALLQRGISQDELLRRIEAVQFWNFFPAAEGPGLRYALPLPMSAFTCKREGGFRTEPVEDRGGHGVVDTLLPHLVYHLLQDQGARFPVPFAPRCVRCNGRLEPIGGWYAVYRLYNTDHWVAFRPRYHAQTKVALSRYRRAAAEGMLYTASALSPYTVDPQQLSGKRRVIFLGRVLAKGELVERIQETLRGAALGALRTRGYGYVEEVQAAEVDLPTMEERLRVFNERLRALWQNLRTLAVNKDHLPEEPSGVYFSVDLLAPGIFRDEDGMPSLVPLFQFKDKVLKPVFWMTRSAMASGWSPAWGLPKPTQLAAVMGSVYVYHWEGNQEEIMPFLRVLERDGVGARRDEGFGECLVCHPFHQEVEEK